jgi:hypothetical protein
MTKKILNVEVSVASGDADYATFRSKTSLLDYDIVLFSPIIQDFLSYAGDFKGKPCLNEATSFQLRECCSFWAREIKQAFEHGKTIVIFLPELKEVFIDTGQRTVNGTGRNAKTTEHVERFNNYNSIPLSVGPISTNGTAIKLVSKGAEILAPYWNQFQESSCYRVLLTDPGLSPCLVTKTGDKTVGALYCGSGHSGSILLLPDLTFDSEAFIKEEDGEEYWSEEGEQFGRRLMSAVVALDAALKKKADVTPEPTWALNNEYALSIENALRAKLAVAEQHVLDAQAEKEAALRDLAIAGRHRALLYEKGKILEAAIVSALQIMGFVAAPFKESDSEFDVVFSSAEGRLIGEAEGKDTKAINVDKLRQLSMNILEDYDRDEVEIQAKPVLFGNAFRLVPPAKRGDPFTEKCHSASSTSSTALVFTPDMFPIVQYLLEHDDEQFASQCRMSIIQTVGRVKFPDLPVRHAAPEAQEVQSAS